MRILQVNTADGRGGAEVVSWRLFQAYRHRGHRSWLAVGFKRSDAPHVLAIPNDACRNRWTRACTSIGDRVSTLVGATRGIRYLRGLFRYGIGQPRRMLDILRGREDFDFPGSWQLLDFTPENPDIVHCHNLHGGYFDLRVLPRLTQKVPTVMTLHDAWLLSGHCAHSLDCQRWKIGCGQCPYLNIPTAIKRDATAYNWQRKLEIYAKSRLYVATPCNWLMKKVEQSILFPAIIENRVIPNGIDLSAFRSDDKEAAREALGLPQDIFILLFVGHRTYSNPWKDYATMEASLVKVATRNKRSNLLFICLGEDRPENEKRLGTARIRFVGYQRDPMKVAQFYQAADVCIHAAKAETFGITLVEAMACGTPVVATAVGGIPEIVKDGYTGFLVPPKKPQVMAARIELLLKDEGLRRELAKNAAEDAHRRFDLNIQVDKYLAWYREIVER